MFKLRAFIPSKRKMVYDVYLYPWNMVVDSDDNVVWHPWIDIELMTSTLQVDRDWKDIYMWDIIKYEGNSRYLAVYYDTTNSQFRFCSSNMDYNYWLTNALSYKVVGNIYETPELRDK